MIPLSIPNIFGNEWKYVKECLDSGWISSAGEYVDKFEEKVRIYTGAKYAIACMNGTAGLHISLKISGVTNDDIVIAPNLTFVATLNSIAYTNATIYLIDVCDSTWQIDVDLLESWLLKNTETIKIEGKTITKEKNTGKKISAIVPVYVLGGFPEIIRLIKVCKKYGISVVEDSTEALGSFSSRKHAGTFGDFGVLSFNGNKIISTGGGGMILNNSEELAKKAKHLTTTAKTDPLDYFHDQTGYNYRLVNVLAAIGVAQMENFDIILERKKKINETYRKELCNVGDIKFQEFLSQSDSNCWLFTFRTKRMRDLLKFLNENGCQSRPFWTPMNNLPMYSRLKYISKSDFSNKIFEQCISIPSSSNLSNDDQNRVISIIKNFFKQ